MRSVALCVLSLIWSMLTYSQNEDSLMIRNISNQILVNGKAYDDLHFLTKQIGSRLTGSPQMVKAEQWGLKTLQKIGADKTWMQECKVPHWVRGGQDRAEAKYNTVALEAKNLLIARRNLEVTALGNSIGTGPTSVNAEVIEIKSFEELEVKKEQVKGKIVFYNYKFNPEFIRTFESYGDAVKYRGIGASRAAKYGAVATIIRSMTHSTDNNPHTGSLIYIDSISPIKIPAIAIGLKDADWLSEMLQKEKVNISMKTKGHFLPDTIGHNVIGELIGSEFPDQIITVGAHLDSWDLAEGAHDDGTGVVQTLEILRTFKAISYKPKHTIRFVLFANEENGGRGGDKYAEEAKAKNEKQVFALETDEGGFTPRGFGFTMSEEQFQKVWKWRELFKPYGGNEFTRGGGGSDVGPLNSTFGVPVAGLLPDSQRYFDVHHARSDVFEAVNKRELELGAINMAALIYLVDKYGL